MGRGGERGMGGWVRVRAGWGRVGWGGVGVGQVWVR